jgi:succinate dehydrogenase/fumarate reductase flavoprotein subunit
MPGETHCDVLVIGSGAGGMSAAISARSRGLDVLVVEKEDCFGGTTCRSGGGLWIPCNPLAQAAGISDGYEAARTYIQLEAGACFDADLVDSYLVNGPRMVDFFQQQTAVRFVLQYTMPDYHPELPGSLLRGRTIYAAPFDARQLGLLRTKIAPPLRELTFLGMGIARTDLQHFFNALYSFKSALFVGRRLLWQLHDLLRYGRSVRFVNGHALAARLVKAASDLEIKLWTSAPATKLDVTDGSVRGAFVKKDGELRKIVAHEAVVLACGGLAHDRERQKALFPHVRAGGRHWSASAPSSTGDGLNFGETVGGRVTAEYPNAGYWAPVSLIPRADDGFNVFPHTNGLDRSKPGFICVNSAGKRFVNECTTYHEFVQAMLMHGGSLANSHAYIICDHAAIRRYGLGFAKPFPMRLKPHLRSGYIVTADSLLQLAERTGIDGPALVVTIDEFNEGARDGRDPKYRRGTNAYDRYQGDPNHKPNPCVAPIGRSPFYALKLVIGDVGTLTGLRTDRHAQVLGQNGKPIRRLYAVGNDMANFCGGQTPGAGVTLGPAMTFGFVAGQHIADRSRSNI